MENEVRYKTIKAKIKLTKSSQIEVLNYCNTACTYIHNMIVSEFKRHDYLLDFDFKEYIAYAKELEQNIKAELKQRTEIATKEDKSYALRYCPSHIVQAAIYKTLCNLRSYYSKVKSGRYSKSKLKTLNLKPYKRDKQTFFISSNLRINPEDKTFTTYKFPKLTYLTSERNLSIIEDNVAHIKSAVITKTNKKYYVIFNVKTFTDCTNRLKKEVLRGKDENEDLLKEFIGITYTGYFTIATTAHEKKLLICKENIKRLEKIKYYERKIKLARPEKKSQYKTILKRHKEALFRYRKSEISAYVKKELISKFKYIVIEDIPARHCEMIWNLFVRILEKNIDESSKTILFKVKQKALDKYTNYCPKCWTNPYGISLSSSSICKICNYIKTDSYQHRLEWAKVLAYKETFDFDSFDFSF